MKSVAAREVERCGRGKTPRDAAWPLVVLADVVDFIRGVTFDKTDAKYRPVDGHVPILRAGNIGNGLTLDDDLVWVPPARVDKEQMLRVGDLAICMSSGSPAVVGKTAQLREPWRGSVGAFCGIIRPRTHVHPDFVALWFRAGAFREWRDGQSRGANIQNLRFSQFATLEIPLPPLAEQKRIAGRLTERLASVDRARAAAQSRLAAAESLPAAYLREVFEGPEASEWETVPMADVCRVVEGQVDPREAEYGVLPHVNGVNIESGTGRILEVRSAADDVLISGKYLFEPGMVLYSKLRPYLRKVAIAPFRGVCSADMYPLTFDPERVASDFAMWSLLAEPFTRYAVAESERARMPKLNRDQLFGWEMPLPPTLTDQRRIAADLAARFAGAKRLAVGVREELAAIDSLPASFLREAFGAATEHAYG